MNGKVQITRFFIACGGCGAHYDYKDVSHFSIEEAEKELEHHGWKKVTRFKFWLGFLPKLNRFLICPSCAAWNRLFGLDKVLKVERRD